MATRSHSSTPADDEPGGVAAVNRALTLLTSFSAGQSHLSLAQLAEKTGFYKSTILRLAESLQAYNFLARDEAGTFRLGPAVLSLAETYRSDLHPAEIVMPVLRALVNDALESASLYVSAGDGKRLCAYRVTSSRPITDNVKVGDMLPITQGAGGRVLLAFGAGRVDAPTAAKLQVVRRCMFSITRGERDPETAAIACPVFGLNGKLEGAVALSGLVQRFQPESVARMRGPLFDAARRLTAGFGGDAAVYDKAEPYPDPAPTASAPKRRPTARFV